MRFLFLGLPLGLLLQLNEVVSGFAQNLLQVVLVRFVVIQEPVVVVDVVEYVHGRIHLGK